MRFSGRIAVIFLAGAMVADGGGAVAASARYRCDTEAIRDCSPSGCTEEAASGNIALELPGWTYRRCLGSDCQDGALDAWSGKSKPEDRGFVGFSQAGKVDGFTGSVDFDSGAFVLIDGSHYWFGRCKAQ